MVFHKKGLIISQWLYSLWTVFHKVFKHPCIVIFVLSIIDISYLEAFLRICWWIFMYTVCNYGNIFSLVLLIFVFLQSHCYLSILFWVLVSFVYFPIAKFSSACSIWSFELQGNFPFSVASICILSGFYNFYIS